MTTKVLFLFPRFYIGGVSKALSFVANKCAEADMNVYCISMSSQPETVHFNESISREIIDIKEMSKGLLRFYNRLSFMYRLRKRIKQISPDVILVFRADLVKAVVYDTIGLHIPIIGSERGNPLLYGNLLKNYRKVFERCAAIVYQTEAAKNVYDVATKSVIIPNPAVSHLGNSSVRQIRKGRNIVSVGRLSKEKNFIGLIKAYSKVYDKLSDRKLIIYGDGPQESELRSLVKDLHLEERIIFGGNVKDFTSMRDDSSIFVLNTLSEGMPNALIEAMIAGYACICTDCPIGAPSWLSDNGRRVKLVPVNDNEELANALVDIANNESKAVSLAYNASEIIEILHPDRIGEKWVLLIDEIKNESN